MSSKDIRSFFKPITKRNKFSELINQLPDSETSTAKIQEHFEVGTNNFMKKELEKNRTDSSNVNSDSSSDVKKKGGKKVVRNPTVNLNHCKNKKLETGLPLEESSIVSSSDSDDSNIINATPSKCKQKKRKIQIISSDSEEELQLKHGKLSESNTEKLIKMEHFEPINIDNIFGKTVKQSKFEVPSQSSQSFVKKSEKNIDPRKKKEFTEIGIHRDKEFEKTLIDLDDELFLQNEDILDKTIESALSKGYDHSSSVKSDMDMKGEYPKLGGNISGMKRALETDVNIDDHVVKKKSKFEHTDSGIDSQERNEKKRYCATQYQQYLNRSGPKNHGCKAIPKGTPDCLANLCFIRTGVLDSLEAEEFEDLIKQHGGRVVHAVSRKVNFVVVGEDAGKAKLAKAANYGIPNINEDELLDMISQKSKTVNKSLASNISSFEDAGIDDSFISCDSEEATVIKNQPAAKIVKYSDDKIVLEPGKKKELVKESEKNTCVNTNKAKIKVERKEENSGNKFVETKSNIQKLESNMESAEKLEASNICLSEKYKPKELKQIIGQQVNNSNMHKLKKWLESWYENERLRKEKKIPQHRSWDKTNDGAFYKCALLSGSPGVGKTTTAVLVAECLGYDIIEFNASDTRSKKLLQQEVSNALSTKNISSFNVYNKVCDKKRVLLMDEVDGMAGNEDRGGMQELLNLIKISKIPIICMCNDRSLQKMRSLANYCFDLRFEKPKVQQILGFVMSICFRENIKMNPQVASEIINGTACDIRQTLNQISMLANLDYEMSLPQAQKEATSSKKDTVLSVWQVCKMVFNEADQKGMSLMDKSRLFFYDYSLGPLFVQENYLKVQPHVQSKNVMKHVAAAAEAISVGASIDMKIRESNNWSLLDMQAIYSSVLPGHYMSGHFVGSIEFPRWLGNNSKRNKHNRLNSELAMHTKVFTSGGALAMNLEYSKPLLESIVFPLKKRGLDGVQDAVEVMKSYQLLREDLDSLVELNLWPKQKGIMDGIDSKIKAAFTRLYKKEVPVFSYSANHGGSRKKVLYDDQFNEDESEALSEPEEDTIESDNLISKAKTKGRNKKNPSTSKTKAKRKK